MAAGEWITNIDSDDFWTLDRLETFAAFVKAHPKAGFVFSNGYLHRYRDSDGYRYSHTDSHGYRYANTDCDSYRNSYSYASAVHDCLLRERGHR